MIVPWTRNEGGALAGLKTISYAENVRALAYVEEHGAHEAIFANTQGQPLRGDGLERVPRARRRVLHAAALGRLPQRRDPSAAARARPTRSASRSRSATCRSTRCADADEAFVSSTVREVQPIATVDGVALPPRPARSPTRARRRLHRASRPTRPRPLTPAQHVGRRRWIDVAGGDDLLACRRRA